MVLIECREKGFVKMKKTILGVLVVMIFFSAGIYYYKSHIKKHFLIVSAEEYIKSLIKSPSSYSLKEVSFYVLNKENPKMLIEFNSNNSFGVQVENFALFEFGRTDERFGTKEGTALYNLRVKFEEKFRNRVFNRDEVLTPFENLKLLSVNINGEILDEINIAMLRNKIENEKKGYWGPNLGGSIDHVNEDGSVICSFDTKQYIPNKFPPYQ